MEVARQVRVSSHIYISNRSKGTVPEINSSTLKVIEK